MVKLHDSFSIFISRIPADSGMNWRKLRISVTKPNNSRGVQVSFPVLLLNVELSDIELSVYSPAGRICSPHPEGFNVLFTYIARFSSCLDKGSVIAKSM